MTVNRINNGTTEKKEHVLVCLSPSPSNKRIVIEAGRLAEAFNARFTALYVQDAEPQYLSEEENERLRSNMRMAEKLGATIVSVVRDSVPVQIAEYARVSGVTKIVIGQSAEKKLFNRRKSITEQVIVNAKDVDVYIIPDSYTKIKTGNRGRYVERIVPSPKDLLLTFLILVGATLVGILFRYLKFTEADVITVYILGVLINSVLARSPVCSLLSSFCSVLLFNYYFTAPELTLRADEPGNYVTFFIMLVASLFTGTLANRLKDNAKQSARDAFRTRILFDTNQLLQKARSDDEVIKVAANQVLMLLNQAVIIYPVENGKLGNGYVFAGDNQADAAFFAEPLEEQTAEWVLQNKKRAGATTGRFADAGAMYLNIRINDATYGVIGIRIDKKHPIGNFEYSVLMSILGECALTIENLRNEKAREKAEALAQKEQLRANLLRTISHDLRTPLTAISGNASNLKSHYKQLDDETREQIFSDIWDDSEWLINLVENLLYVTRIENGHMQLNTSVELLSDVIDEAMRHVDHNVARHNVEVQYSEDFLFVEIDSKLIVQVIINIVNNAIKYTQEGSLIHITTGVEGDMAFISIADNGKGMSDEEKQHAFDMFYTGHMMTADGKRSIGLGLALCKTVIEAHGGTIEIKDNQPCGCIVKFFLKKGDVVINEQDSGIGC